MAIFNSYVKLPEGRMFHKSAGMNIHFFKAWLSRWQCWLHPQRVWRHPSPSLEVALWYRLETDRSLQIVSELRRIQVISSMAGKFPKFSDSIFPAFPSYWNLHWLGISNCNVWLSKASSCFECLCTIFRPQCKMMILETQHFRVDRTSQVETEILNVPYFNRPWKGQCVTGRQTTVPSARLFTRLSGY